jgi:hypothetical protein
VVGGEGGDDKERAWETERGRKGKEGDEERYREVG